MIVLASMAKQQEDGKREKGNGDVSHHLRATAPSFGERFSSRKVQAALGSHCVLHHLHHGLRGSWTTRVQREEGKRAGISARSLSLGVPFHFYEKEWRAPPRALPLGGPCVHFQVRGCIALRSRDTRKKKVNSPPVGGPFNCAVPQPTCYYLLSRVLK